MIELLRESDPISDAVLDLARIEAAKEHAAACALWGLDLDGNPIEGSTEGEEK